MIIIAEKLNSSVPKTAECYKAGDDAAIIGLIKAQEAAGADYIDVNTATSGDELKTMLHAIGLIRQNSKCGIVIDSPDTSVIAQAAKAASGRQIILNSISTHERTDELLPLLLQTSAGVICMPTDERRIPDNAQDRLKNASVMIEKLTGAGVKPKNIYIDALVQSIAFDPQNGKVALETISAVKRAYPEVRVVCGASNVSFGLPKRSIINASFLCCAIYAGLDCAITDITSPRIKEALASTLAVTGDDEYCMDYLEYIREQ